jgi:hypothetical protein
LLSHCSSPSGLLAPQPAGAAGNNPHPARSVPRQCRLKRKFRERNRVKRMLFIFGHKTGTYLIYFIFEFFFTLLTSFDAFLAMLSVIYRFCCYYIQFLAGLRGLMHALKRKAPNKHVPAVTFQQQWFALDLRPGAIMLKINLRYNWRPSEACHVVLFLKTRSRGAFKRFNN